MPSKIMILSSTNIACTVPRSSDVVPCDDADTNLRKNCLARSLSWIGNESCMGNWSCAGVGN